VPYACLQVLLRGPDWNRPEWAKAGAPRLQGSLKRHSRPSLNIALNALVVRESSCHASNSSATSPSTEYSTITHVSSGVGVSRSRAALSLLFAAEEGLFARPSLSRAAVRSRTERIIVHTSQYCICRSQSDQFYISFVAKHRSLMPISYTQIKCVS
jgi:hypothetical protein